MQNDEVCVNRGNQAVTVLIKSRPTRKSAFVLLISRVNN